MYPGFVGTFISHILSLLSAIWAIVRTFSMDLKYYELNWIKLSFLFITFNSCLALVRYGNSTFGYKLRRFHMLTLSLSTVISFSIVEFVLHGIYNSPDYLMFAPILNTIPFLQNLQNRDYRTNLNFSDVVIAANSFIITYLSYCNENYFAIAMNLTYLFTYFVVGDSGFLFDTELPSIDACQYLTCFLNAFTIYSFIY